MRHDYAIYALTQTGAALARKIAGYNGGTVFLPVALQPEENRQQNATAESKTETLYFQRFADCLAENWLQYSCQVLVCASGIALRALAPLLRGKKLDPAVLLLDQEGHFVISLLGGHLAEANRLAKELAERLTGEITDALAGELAGQSRAVPVITTASDNAGLPAIDLMAEAANLRLGNLKAARAVSAAWLRGEKALLFDPQNSLKLDASTREAFFLPLLEVDDIAPARLKTGAACVLVENTNDLALNQKLNKIAEQADKSGNILYLTSKKLWLGLGCRRGIEAAQLRRFARRELLEAGYHPRDLAGLTSLDLKQDEAALLDLAQTWELPLRFFSSDELNVVAAPNPSPRVKQVTGTASVCEAAALLAATAALQTAAAGPAALLLPKRKSAGATLALAGPLDYASN